jgi:hypothetical protein
MYMAGLHGDDLRQLLGDVVRFCTMLSHVWDLVA